MPDHGKNHGSEAPPTGRTNPPHFLTADRSHRRGGDEHHGNSRTTFYEGRPWEQKFVKTKTSNKPDKNMKTTDQIKITPGVGHKTRTTAASPAPQQEKEQASHKNAIRPFHAKNVPEAELVELRRRINATRWPEKETVTDASQGVQLATTQALARYWATDYDWRKIEAKLMPCRSSSPGSMDWIFTSSTCVRSIKTRCRSSSHTAGRARSSSR